MPTVDDAMLKTGSRPCKREKREKCIHTFIIFCFQLGFPALMDCTLELGPKISPSSLQLLLSEEFITTLWKIAKTAVLLALFSHFRAVSCSTVLLLLLFLK